MKTRGDLRTILHRCVTALDITRSFRDPGVRSRLRRTGLAVASLGLLLASSAGAADFFAGNLTAQSSWDEIRRTRGIEAEFPSVRFANMYAPMPMLCLVGEELRLADPKLDNGVRVAARRSETRAASGASRYATLRTDRFSTDAVTGPAVPTPAPPEQSAATDPQSDETMPTRYDIRVYRVITTGFSPVRVFLFTKSWEVPACAKP
jgi:hypothetical protein